MINKQRMSRKQEIEVTERNPLYIEIYEQYKDNIDKVLRNPNEFKKREENQFKNKVLKDYIFNSDLLINSRYKI
jgi:hypothetical protein